MGSIQKKFLFFILLLSALVLIFYIILKFQVSPQEERLVLDCSGKCNKTNDSVKLSNEFNFSVFEKTVTDCSGVPPPLKCTTKKIRHTIKNCNHWIPEINALNDLKCDNTTEDLNLINLISTYANHIRAKITNEKYSVTVLPININETNADITNLKVYTGNSVQSGWDIEFLPDGTFLATTRGGALKHYHNKYIHTIAKIPVITDQNAGLLGLAIDISYYSENRYIYMLYTYSYDNISGKDRIFNRISRFTYSNDLLRNEVVLLDKIPGTSHHAGGRIAIGPDNKLYATTGDTDQPIQSQNLSFLGGKILRMNLDGSIPADNPFNNSYVFSYGHRNPQGLAWHPE
ncbi:PQQ-dependent sugar dehydrogenase [Candidatus Woesearchaeota archaeon]|nr:PQQ-dependent sugar dehydrogenase [Candidatus Woesearchaeota archaeon]